jgi:hypothetical protein
MLYVYEGKVYIRPFDYKMVEVKVSKKGNEYNVEATEKEVELNQEIRNKTFEITIEKAYEMQNKGNKSSKFNLDSKLDSKLD